MWCWRWSQVRLGDGAMMTAQVPPQPPVAVVCAAAGEPWEARVVSALSQNPREALLSRRSVDVVDLLATAEAGLASVAVVSAQLYRLDADALARLARCGVAVLGVFTDSEQERHWSALGVTAISDQAIDADLIPALGGLARPPTRPTDALGWSGPPPASRPPHGDPDAKHDTAARTQVADEEARRGAGKSPARVVAVWGPTGAPGRTTVAVTLAAVLADRGARVLLVDADTYGGSVANYLGIVQDVPGLAAACLAAGRGRLDRDGLARHCQVVGDRLAVLTGIPRPERWGEVRPDAFEHVLLASRGIADVVVVDCGFAVEQTEELVFDTMAPRRNAATLLALDMADETVVVGAADPLGVPRLVGALETLAEMYPGRRPHVVANRVRRSVVGPRPGEQVRRALADYADRPSSVIVPLDQQACDEGLRLGLPLVEVAPRSGVVRAIEGLASDLTPAAAAAPAPSRRLSGRVNRLLGRRATPVGHTGEADAA